MENLFLGFCVIGLLIIWFEEKTFEIVHEKVKKRRSAGDRTCDVRKVWWGWKVIEYGECDL